MSSVFVDNKDCSIESFSITSSTFHGQATEHRGSNDNKKLTLTIPQAK
ncbi:hypothetical protein [Legionella parisiensis]|nr:hypothetical protein [Legionella parisiensis]